jgi:hypothetical protein
LKIIFPNHQQIALIFSFDIKKKPAAQNYQRE